MKIVRTIVLILLLGCLIGCEQLKLDNFSLGNNPDKAIPLVTTDHNLAEVPPPKVIRKLNQDLEQYKPQVEIVVPQAGTTFNQTDIAIELKLENLPIFQDDKLRLGNHLNLIIDNEPLQEIYNLDEPIMIKDLSPGTHAVRVFAVRPWGESFKNQGAYDLTTFNILTETNDNRLQLNLPLLTYNSPTGTIGAEPLLLDFYLTNAPLHGVAQNNPNLLDWGVRATVNGTSFMLEDWQPTYLTGLKPGENWIQLELIDEAGNNIENIFNNTVRVFNYDPQQQDTLAKLLTNQISLAEARAIVEQNYYIQPIGTPEIIEPSKKVEPELTINAEESVSNIVPNVEDNRETKESEEDKRRENAIPEEKSNLSSIVNSDTEQVQTEKSEQPLIIPAPETKTIEDSSVKEINSFNIKDTEEKIIIADSTESQEITTNTPDNSDSPKPITAIKKLQPESANITEDDIPIIIPQTEAIRTSEQKTEPLVWWKKILVSLRQKLEGLVRLLPKDA